MAASRGCAALDDVQGLLVGTFRRAKRYKFGRIALETKKTIILDAAESSPRATGTGLQVCQTPHGGGKCVMRRVAGNAGNHERLAQEPTAVARKTRLPPEQKASAGGPNVEEKNRKSEPLCKPGTPNVDDLSLQLGGTT